MIWMIITEVGKRDGTLETFRFAREAFGKENIKLALVNDADKLDFVTKGDIVWLRTASEKLINTICQKGVKNTAEYFDTYCLVEDKTELTHFLIENGINVPRQYSLNEIRDGFPYFVKLRYGEDSIGVTKDSICHSKAEVVEQLERIKSELGRKTIIEDFIDGKEYTCCCAITKGEIHSHAISVICEETYGIQTQNGKANHMEYGEPLPASKEFEIKCIAGQIVDVLKIKHHARIDFRENKNGKLYVIDVNLLPGFSPLGDWSRCYLLAGNYSYIDSMKLLVGTATC